MVFSPGKPGTPNVLSAVVSVDSAGENRVPWEKATRSAGFAVRPEVVGNVLDVVVALALCWKTGAHGKHGQGRCVVSFSLSVWVLVVFG